MHTTQANSFVPSKGGQGRPVLLQAASIWCIIAPWNTSGVDVCDCCIRGLVKADEHGPVMSTVICHQPPSVIYFYATIGGEIHLVLFTNKDMPLTCTSLLATFVVVLELLGAHNTGQFLSCMNMVHYSKLDWC